DSDGKYLYYRSQRWFDPTYSSYDTTWIYMNGEALVAVPLRKDVPSPLAPRNDEEGAAKPEEKKSDEKPAEDKKDEPKKDDAPKVLTVSVEPPKPAEGSPTEAKSAEKA